MSKLFYTGVGAEETPPDIQEIMRKMALFLRKKGFIMRSGHCIGADWAFEKPLLSYIEKKKPVTEIYLAWNNFGRGEVPKVWHDGINYFTFINFDKKIQEKATKLAASVNEHWDKCTEWARLLLSRDVCQVMGQDLKTPSKFVLVWTPEAAEVGGSRIAIRIAKKNKIPVYNIADTKQLDKFREFCKTL